MIQSIAYCVGITLAFVLVIYVGTDGRHRNDPAVAKLRCMRVLLLSLVTQLFVYLVYDENFYGDGTTIYEVLGWRQEGLLQAAVLPLVLTQILFLGPIVVHFFIDGYYTLFMEPHFWLVSLKDPLWIRDHICAPLVEELCFRSCVLPLLFPHLGHLGSALLGPFLFGICHAHHLYERTQRFGLQQAILTTLFQVGITTVFGMYASYLFLRTGHIIPCILVHSFCNYMGVPEVTPDRPFVFALHVVGVLLWLMLVQPLTDPSLFSNKIFA